LIELLLLCASSQVYLALLVQDNVGNYFKVEVNQDFGLVVYGLNFLLTNLVKRINWHERVVD
jgi:hypothetical protein